jgi:CRISPR system Cascade subunit CasD
MSTEISHLALRLDGPLQAWGYASQFNRRNTSMFPIKSAILGMCCAAMGIPRGSEREREVLPHLRLLRLLTVAIPRLQYRGTEHETPLLARRLVDYHTVQNTLTAEGKIKDTHLTWRQYLCDASFVAVLSGNRQLLGQVADALGNPIWGIWLGRKACIPSAPVLDRIYDSEEEALEALLRGKSLSAFSHQREVDRFEDGTDTFSDEPLCFGGSSAARSFSPRRIKLTDAKMSW